VARNQGRRPGGATAIHAGHELWAEVESLMKLSESDRLREEDPFTDHWVGVAKNRIVIDRSRFEVDLNRPRDKAIYVDPEDAWASEGRTKVEARARLVEMRDELCRTGSVADANRTVDEAIEAFRASRPPSPNDDWLLALVSGH